MPLTLELPPPIDAELTHEAQREGVSETDRAALIICLTTALTGDEKPTPFQDAVKLFFAHRALDVARVASVLEELVTVCLKSPTGEGKTSAALEASYNMMAHRNSLSEEEALTHLRAWRNALVHRAFVTEPLDVSPDVILSSIPPIDTIIQRTGRIDRKKAPGSLGDTLQERDPDLVTRVKAIRGKYAHTAKEPGTEELHRERQQDKAKEEAQIRGYES